MKKSVILSAVIAVAVNSPAVNAFGMPSVGDMWEKTKEVTVKTVDGASKLGSKVVDVSMKAGGSAVDIVKSIPFSDVLNGMPSEASNGDGYDDMSKGMGVMPSFVFSVRLMNEAMIEMTEAYGLKEEADLLRSEGESLKGGASEESDIIETMAELHGDASAKIRNKMAEKKELSKESIAQFSKGIGYGMFSGYVMTETFSAMAQDPVVLALQVGTAAKPMFNYGLQVKDAVVLIYKFASENGVEMPSSKDMKAFMAADSPAENKV